MAQDELMASSGVSDAGSATDYSDSDDSDISDDDAAVTALRAERYNDDFDDEAEFFEAKAYKRKKKPSKYGGKKPSYLKERELMALRGQEQSYLEQMGATKEFAETHYYNDKEAPRASTTGKVSYHAFWSSVAEYAIANEGSLKNFADSSFIYHAGENFTAQAAILSFLDLPEKASSHGLRPNQSRGLEINAANNLLVFLKEVRETETKDENQIIVVQRYFEGNDSNAKVSLFSEL